MTSTLIIRIEDIPSSRPVVYVGDHVRVSTATSVVFLNANTLACCHFNGCKMFLFRFNFGEGTYTLLDSIDTTFNGKRTETDLMATDGYGNMVTTNFFHTACTFYRYENDKLHFTEDLKFAVGNFVHGVKYYNQDIVAVTSRDKSSGVHFINRKTNKLEFVLPTPGLSVQDVCFLSENRFVMVSGHGSPKLHSADIYSSVLHIISFDAVKKTATILANKVFEKSHLDNIVVYKNRLYVTDQYNNKVLCFDAETLAPQADYEGYDFPHGIDVNYDIVAVTNYGSNTVELRSLHDGVAA